MISRCSFSRGWPTNSSSRRGRSVVSSAPPTGSASGSSSSSRLTTPHPPAGPRRSRQDRSASRSEVLDRAVVGELAEHVADLVGQ